MGEEEANANQLKVQGNESLKSRKFEEALNYYSKAIEVDPSNAILYTNRAQTYIKLESYGFAIRDCDEALKQDPDSVKAYYRKGICLMAILNYKEAQNNFKEILKRLPNDTLTLEHNKQCSSFLKRQAFEKAIAGDEKVSVINSVNYEDMVVEKYWRGPELKIRAHREHKGADVEVEIEGLDKNYLKYMIGIFKDGGKLPKKHVHAIVAKVQHILKQEHSLLEISLPHSKIENPPGERERLLEGCEKLTVVGDTHGQFFDLLNLFQRYGFVSERHAYLFNGDFVDRGSWSCEVALYLYVLKILYPHRIYINRGNHETVDMNKTYGFADECEHKYSRKVFDVFSESFGALPLAALLNRSYLVMHGGLFSNDLVTLDDLRNINRFPASGATQPPREGLPMELLWTDPQQENGRAPSKRGIGIQFGPDVTERFCLSNKIRKVLRSHEVRMQGVEEEHNGRMLTVFSAPNYCDSTGNLGGVVHFIENASYNEKKDDGQGYRDAKDPNCPWLLEKDTFLAVPHPDLKPMAYSNSVLGF